MTQSELKAQIKSKSVGGAYIFCGEEDYLKKYYLSEFANICCPDEAFSIFNRITFDGEDVNLEEISEAIKSPPMTVIFENIAVGQRRFLCLIIPIPSPACQQKRRNSANFVDPSRCHKAFLPPLRGYARRKNKKRTITP